MTYGYNQAGYQVPIYGGYTPPVPDQLAQLRGAQIQQPMAQSQPQQPVNNGINWVQGEEGARAYMVAPGNTVMLMDSDGSSFYLKTADASGMPQPLRIFDYTERTIPQRQHAEASQQNVDYVTRAEFKAVIDELEALKAKKVQQTKRTVKENEDA